MTQTRDSLTPLRDLSTKVAQVFQKRLSVASERYAARLADAWEREGERPGPGWNPWLGAGEYFVDAAQRSVLFWDTLRERGNAFVEHTRAGLPPLLHFDSEPVMDGAALPRPVNYALLRILPPQGVVVDPKRRPYVIIDPRAGHGPGIGGFKDDSQVGVALRDGHPVYFVVFRPEPEPGQTLVDVCEAEAAFVRRVRELHPDSPKPAIVGNCQGGWAAMMLAASNPEDTGPIVINGAPMSYWGGAWSEGAGDNPMRYAGGLLGGTWLASLAADLGNGRFDGAWLVQNFENLNPANTFWEKYYHLYASVDTERPRFLEFERWWGGFYLMNREEIEWITRNLFVGNRLWSGQVADGAGKSFDLREIRVPIVLFASMGDNITPPQQAFNWVADVYGSTEEIKARGQVIVGLLHERIGHLGIFVSGGVARKEHAQIVSVLKSIEALPPGLYAMDIEDRGEVVTDGSRYAVRFLERRLEDVAARLNCFGRADEKPFEAVAAFSEFNQRAYELFVRPFVQPLVTESAAAAAREFHPLRASRWLVSDLNPWTAWLKPAAAAVNAQRHPVDPDQPARRAERLLSEGVSAWFDWQRDLRDALSEAAFFGLYGTLFQVSLAGRDQPDAGPSRPAVSRDSLLPAAAEGGYAAAFARVGSLLACDGPPLPLERVALRKRLAEEYRELLPALTLEELRRNRGLQDNLVADDPERALATLPELLADPADRERLVTLAGRLLADPRVAGIEPTAGQRRMLGRIRRVLGLPAAAPARRPALRGRPAQRSAR